MTTNYPLLRSIYDAELMNNSVHPMRPKPTPTKLDEVREAVIKTKNKEILKAWRTGLVSGFLLGIVFGYFLHTLLINP